MDDRELETWQRVRMAPVFLLPLAWIAAEVVFFNAKILPIILGLVTVVLLGALFFLGLKRVDDKTVDILYHLRANARVQALVAVVALVASLGVLPRGTGPLVALLILIIAVIVNLTPRGITGEEPKRWSAREDWSPPVLPEQPSPIEALRDSIKQPTTQDASSLPADPWQQSA